MRLKKMELQGFKSFAQKTTIEFGKGITAVVGPNGSGKSNISDAVRWALGEQSAKQLRGSKMEDIIFNGAKEKKPLGFAEVSLFFDNRDSFLPIDYNEVVVTRRMYRSGESDYRLNNNLCRLKDIHELFMGTGVGKESYSTIEQGKIDTITSTKAEDRRQVFEEAAGILKHKLKKKESLHRLGEVEQKIQRLEDILKEIQSNLAPLQEQKEKALRYQELTSLVEEAEKKLHLHNYSSLKQEKKKLDEKTISLEKEQNSLSEEIKDNSEKSLYLEEKLQKTDGSLTKKLLEIKEKENEIALTEERIQSGKAQIERLEKERENQALRIKTIKEKLEEESKHEELEKSHIAKLDEMMQAIALDKSNEEKTKKETEVEEKTKELDNLKADIIDLLNQKAKTQYELQKLEEERNDEEKSADELEKNQKNIEADLRENENSIKENLEKKEMLAKKRADLEEKSQSAQSRLVELKDSLKKRQDSWQENEKILNQKKSHRRVLGDLEESLDGYYKGARSVLNSKHKQAFIGTVAQLITVEKKYEIAIEMALGGSLQHIITPTYKDAQRLIAYLKETNGGRATFLPLDRVKGVKKQFPMMEGFLGTAVDLIGFDERYNGVMAQLLGRVLISDNLAHASEIALKTEQRYKIITLEGDMISPGGAMTGGSFQGKQSGLLSRKREIRELDESLLLLVKNKEEMQKEILNLQKEIEATEQSVADLKNELLESEYQAKNLEQAYNEALKNKNELLEEEKRLQWQKEQAKKSKIEKEEKEKKQRINYQEMLLEEDKKRALILKYEEDLQQMKQELSILTKDNTEMKLQLASWEKDKEHANSLIELAKKNILDLEATLKNYENEEKSRLDRIDEIKKESALGETEKEELKKTVATLVEESDSITKVKNDLQDKLKEIKQKQIDISGKKDEIEKKLLRLASQVAKQEEKLQNAKVWLMEKCEEPYPEIDLSTAEIKSLQSETKENNAKIAELGLVNLASIEEYDKLKERFDYLSGQYSDLKEARESLDEILAELDQIMEKKFKETFKVVTETFERNFLHLFGGGEAKIYLSEPENILTSGVEIMVRPPNKKMQALSLLSGGEKSLTAVALLLAILEVAPSPFCLLDEIDAAFDDKNVARVAEKIKEMAEEMQFIIITHRKGAMEVADALYGLTMEKGLSRLISVKLEDYS